MLSFLFSFSRSALLHFGIGTYYLQMASVMAAPAAHNRYSAAVPVPAATVYTVELPPVLAVYTEMLLPAAPAGSDSGSQSAAPVVPEKPAVPDCQP